MERCSPLRLKSGCFLSHYICTCRSSVLSLPHHIETLETCKPVRGVKFLTSCRSANLISLINVNPNHRLGKATAAHVAKQGVTSMLCSYPAGDFLVAHDISLDQAWQREVRSGRQLKSRSNCILLGSTTTQSLGKKFFYQTSPEKNPTAGRQLHRPGHKVPKKELEEITMLPDNLRLWQGWSTASRLGLGKWEHLDES